VAATTAAVGVLVTAVLVLAGCAGIEMARPPSPRMGAMWALFTDDDIVLGPRAMLYTRSQVACEQERLRRLERACVPVTIGPGSDYYALGFPQELDIQFPDGAIGSTDRDRCGRFRALHMSQYRLVGDCEPIGVTRAP
jgi:hypothetical protein